MVAKKKESKAKVEVSETDAVLEQSPSISSRADLKNLLLSIRDRLEDETAAAIYAVSAMNYILNLESLTEYLDQDNKELARDIWLRIKQSGMQVRNPAALFGADAVVPAR